MRETPDELEAMQRLLDLSHAGASDHLRGIVSDQRTLRAADIAALTTGMRLLSLATVTAGGEPRVSAVDGHLLHGRWVFSTSRTSAKARQMHARPGVSASFTAGEEFAVFTHGRAERLDPGHHDFDEVDGHLTEHYGSSPMTWGDTALYRIEPTWIVGYAFDRDEVLARHGLDP